MEMEMDRRMSRRVVYIPPVWSGQWPSGRIEYSLKGTEHTVHLMPVRPMIHIVPTVDEGV